jgi:outer membrane protein assembly factor BamB
MWAKTSPPCSHTAGRRLKFKKMKNIFFFAFIVIVSNCKPKDPPAPDSSVPTLVWQTALGERGSSIHPIISGDYVVFSKERATTPVQEPLKILDKKTGKYIGEWNDILGTGGGIADLEGRGIYENSGIMLLPLGSRVHAIDIKTNKTVWKNKDSDVAEENLTGIGHTIFHSKYKTINGIDNGYVAKGNIMTGQWETIFTDTILPDYKNTLQTPIPFIDKNNDTLLFIVQTKYRFPPQESSRNNLYCYNLSKRQLKYKVEITKPTEGDGLSIVLQPQIDGDKIIIRAENKLICFNANIGNKIWEVETKDQLNARNSWASFTVGGGKVFGYASASNVVCFDLETGAQKWKLSTPKSGNIIGGMQYYNGYVYYSTGGLEAIEAETGKHVWNYEDPEKEFFTLGMRVDKVAGKIYIGDYKGNAFCFEAIK